jgi:hypothetical protein
MSRVIQVDKTATTAGAEYIEVDFPSPANILQVIIAGSSAFNATIYNRAITGPAIAVQSILEDADSGDTRFILEAEHNYQVGDTITVASAATGGYNVAHVVAAVPNSQEVITDQTHTADENPTAATMTLAVLAALQPAFEVLELTAAASNVVRFNGTRIFSTQQKDLINTVRPQGKLYVLVSDADTYTISIRGNIPVR